MLKWRKANWPESTYHAREGNMAFTVDKVGPGWAVRGWTDGKFSLYVDVRTMREGKQCAQDVFDAKGEQSCERSS